MQNEDDLRGLAKVMEFMRAISILFVVINIYWFCYQSFREWGINIGVVDRILLGFQRTAGLFSSIFWTKLFAVLFLALSCLGTNGREGAENHLAQNNPLRRDGLVAVLFQLVALGTPFALVGKHGVLHRHPHSRIYLSAHGRTMDVKATQNQPA